MFGSRLSLNFAVLNAATKNRYLDGDNIRLVNLGPIALFSICKLASIIGKHIEEINQAHIISLMYKLLTSSRGSDDLSIGFDGDHYKRQRELTTNKNQKGEHHGTIKLKGHFGFAEHQEKELTDQDIK